MPRLFLPRPKPPVSDEVRTERRAYRRMQRAMFLVGLLIFLSGVGFYFSTDKNQSSIGRTLSGPLDDIWYAEYLLSGLAIMWGTQRPAPNIERVGHILFLTALAINTIAVLLVLGSRSLTTIPAYVIAAWVSWGRLHDLTAAAREAQHRQEITRLQGIISDEERKYG
jgi:hypothetical protein